MYDFSHELNAAQHEAATLLEGPVLVVAGAGSGKTRTIVYRLANLMASGVPASKILLLTFTRKASREMLERAARLMDGRSNGALSPAGVQGGTFHAFAYSVLRVFPPVEFPGPPTVMDSADMLAILTTCRKDLGLSGRGEKGFPKSQTVLSCISKSRNLEMNLETLLMRESPHLFPYAADMENLATAYAAFKRANSLFDYDDLLFELENLLRTNAGALAWCRRKHSHIMIDEYQDTNLVQARLAALLSGFAHGGEECGETGARNIMVVGDDAQSIYAFRGADVRNIREFPELFPGTRIIRLEENYRSTQPVLDLANAVLENAPGGYAKHLFTRREGGSPPEVIRPLSDLSQAGAVAQRIVDLLRRYPPHEIAVLFRAGYQSYHLEIQLARLGIRFGKYGGVRYTEAAHIKDAVSFARLALNPLDFTAFQRIAHMTKGIGEKTCRKLYEALRTSNTPALHAAAKKFPGFGADLAFIDSLRARRLTPETFFTEILAHYTPTLRELYPDDHPKRLQGLEELAQIAASYADLDVFISDLSLADPMEEEAARDHITLSTIHSAKGLEWDAVLIIDLVEERFPSRHAMQRNEDLEEERRLMYVAVTRAREYLGLFVPASLYSRGAGTTVPAEPSPFVRLVPPTLYAEWREEYKGKLTKRALFTPPPEAPPRSAFAPMPDPDEDSREAASTGVISPLREGGSGYCRHKVFGRGKIVQFLPPDKYRVNFPGMGLKVIMGAFLQMED